MVKEIFKIGNIISKKEFGCSLRLKFRNLCLKIKKNTDTSAGKESFSNILGERVSEMHLRVPVETQQVGKMDLPFLFIWAWNGTFANRLDFRFTFPYHPNFEPILDRFVGFVSTPLCECNFSPTGLLEWTGAYQYKIALMAV